MIFINAQDAIAARIFTLTHELVPLWTGTSGISNPELKPGVEDMHLIERYCYQIAADFITTNQEFIHRWKKVLNTLHNTQALASFFISNRYFHLG